MDRTVKGGGSRIVTRRGILKTGIGVGAAGLLVPLATPHVWAKTYPSMGTYPAGVEGKTVFAAGLFPLTGPYASLGNDEKLGFQLAIDHLNNGSPVTEAIASLKKGGGLLGKKLESGIADSQTHSNPAVQAASRFIEENKAMVMTGAISSAIAVALEELGQRKKVIYMGDVTASNATTGKNCQKFGFRLMPDAYMACEALAPVLSKALGRNLKAAYLVPDYTYGTSMYSSLTEAFGKFGWTTATEQLAPIGTTDFTSYLLNIASSGADVMFNVMVGADEVTSTEQAVQFGIMKKMKFVIPGMSPFIEKPLGPEVLGGMYGEVPWYWGFQEQNPLAKAFVADFHKKFNYIPRYCAAMCYSSMIMWADAAERAGTFYAPEVISALESGFKVDTIAGKVWFRGADHQGVSPAFILQGNHKSEIKGEADNYKLVEVVPGEKIMQPLEDNGCHMPAVTAA
ncbi:ABC transporter substrate-binding protein [Rhodopila sp.]|uniref:ABC transporter substrate-binding protein n=1 Tax=Rhodopila sp. TaxID=2480087 RepID=UPI003D11CCFC